MKNYKMVLSLMLLANLFAAPVFAHETPAVEEGTKVVEEAKAEEKDYSSHLFGNWGGFRTKLEDSGIDVSVTDTLDGFSNVSGGLQRASRAINLVSMDIGLDGEKIFGAKGLSGTVSLFHNNGGRPDVDLLSSAQGLDNIETDVDMAVIYQAFIEQKFMDDKFSILVGQYEINSEFYVADSAGLFLNPAFGIGSDITATGQNGSTTYPYTSAGVRLAFKPVENSYLLVAAFDGVPGDPANPNANDIKLRTDDGALLIMEGGYQSDTAKLGLGLWRYTEDFDHFTEVDVFGNPVQKSNEGFYLLGEKEIYKESENQGLKAFAKFGTANGEVSQFDYSWSAGLNYVGLIPSRDEGELGLGFTGAHNSSEFRDAAVIAGTPVESSETTVELTYKDMVLPWLAIQPDVQYIVNPGTTVGEDNATVLGIRIIADF